MPESKTRMTAFEIGEPRCVLVLGGEIGALRLTWSEYSRDWCGGLKGFHNARRKGALHTVHNINFDPVERFRTGAQRT